MKQFLVLPLALWTYLALFFLSSVFASAFVTPPAPTSALPTSVPFTTESKAASTTRTTQLYSIPNPLDTLTSGLASICRLPKGVTAVETPPTPDGQLDLLPQFVKLWDIENDPDCRAVREVLTELDVVVQQVIPCAPNSRVFTDASYEYALPVGTTLPRLTIQQSNGEQVDLSGKELILDYLLDLKQQESKMVKDNANDDDDNNNINGFLDTINNNPQAQQILETVLSVWDTVGNVLASALRFGRGTQVTAAALPSAPIDPPRPLKPLILYSYEGNQFCRLVREVLTELDLVYELRSAGKQSPRRSELAYITGGSSQCPYLIDPNTDIDVVESKDIIEYLYKTYARWTPPNELLEWASNVVIPLFQPLFKAVAPLQAGSSNQDDTTGYDADMVNAKAEIEQEIQQHPVVIYTYELSPFCTEATALLKRLDIKFHEVSLGKEWIPGLITAEGARKRAALLKMTGQSSLPHVFIGGKSIGGLFSGTPGLVPACQQGKLDIMVETASGILEKRKSFQLEKKPKSPQKEEGDTVGAFE